MRGTGPSRLHGRQRSGEPGFAADIAGRTAKHGRHCFRLLRQASMSCAPGQCPVNVAELRKEPFAVGRLAETDPDQFAVVLDAELRRLHQVDSVLPARPNHGRVNDLLATLRRRHLN